MDQPASREQESTRTSGNINMSQCTASSLQAKKRRKDSTAVDEIKDRAAVLLKIQTSRNGDGSVLKEYPKYQNDREIVMAAVRRSWGRALEFASLELRNDREVVLACAKYTTGLKFASKELQNDRELVLTAVSLNGYNLAYASPILRNDREVLMSAVKKNGYSLWNASSEFHDDREVVLAAVSNDGHAIQLVSERLRDDRNVVLTAIAQRHRFVCSGIPFLGPTILEYASERLRNDFEIVLAAVRAEAWSLEFASQELKNNREIVLEAVSKCARTFQWASQELKNDRSIVLAVASIDFDVFFSLDQKFRDDPNLVASAVCAQRLRGADLCFDSVWMRCGRFLSEEIHAVAIGIRHERRAAWVNQDQPLKAFVQKWRSDQLEKLWLISKIGLEESSAATLTRQFYTDQKDFVCSKLALKCATIIDAFSDGNAVINWKVMDDILGKHGIDNSCIDDYIMFDDVDVMEQAPGNGTVVDPLDVNADFLFGDSDDDSS